MSRIWKTLKRLIGGGDKAEPAPPPAAKPTPTERPAAAEQNAEPASGWVKAVERLRSTAQGITTAFTAVVIAAIGGGPFIVLDKLDGGVEVAWALWGLAAAVGGSFVVIFVTSEIQKPSRAALADLLTLAGDRKRRAGWEPNDDEGWLVESRRRINMDHHLLSLLTIPNDDRSTPSAGINILDETIKAGLELEMDLSALDDKLVAAYGPPADEGAIAALREERTVLQKSADRVDRDIAGWHSSIVYDEVEERFNSIRPVLFVAGIVTVVGLLTFLGAPHLNTKPADKPDVESAQLALNDETAASILATAPECAIDELTVSVNGGNGSEADPWSVTTDESCGELTLSLTRETSSLLVLPAEENTGAGDETTTESSRDQRSAVLHFFDGYSDEDSLARSAVIGAAVLAITLSLLARAAGALSTRRKRFVDAAVMVFVPGCVAALLAPAASGWVTALCVVAAALLVAFVTQAERLKRKSTESSASPS